MISFYFNVGVIGNGFEAVLAVDGAVCIGRVLAKVEYVASGMVDIETATGEASVISAKGKCRGSQRRDTVAWAEVALFETV